MLCLFLFHIDYSFYKKKHVKKKQCLTRVIELIKNIVIWIPSIMTVFSIRTFSREVKVVQLCFNGELITVSFFMYRRQSRDRLRFVNIVI